MDITKAETFLRDRVKAGDEPQIALRQLSVSIESSIDTLRRECKSLFPLDPQRNTRTMYRVVALVQDIDTNLSLFPFRSEHPLTAPSDGPDEECHLLDATNYFLVPIPGALVVEQASIGQESCSGKINSTRGTKRSSDDVPLPCGAAYETVVTEAGTIPIVTPELRKLLNLPHHPLSPGMLTACIASGIGDAVQLRLNDVVEVFGFLREDEYAPCEGDDQWGWNALVLPRGLVARLTAVHMRHYSPMLDVIPRDTLFGIDDARRLTVRVIAANLCAGDMLAAEYVLLCLIASVVRRHEDIPIGDVPLYLKFPEIPIDFFGRATTFLRSISPVSCVELVLKDDWNRLIPRMDHDKNILISGALQVAAGTTILVDPRCPTAAEAVNDVLLEAVHRQSMKVDYVYSTARVWTANHIIVASCDSPSVGIPALNFACVVSVRPSPCDIPSDDVLPHIRSYIGNARRQLGDLNNEDDKLATRMANEMADAAQRYPTRFNRDALIHNNTFSAIAALTRAHAASWGHPAPCEEDFVTVMTLEASRCDRV